MNDSSTPAKFDKEAMMDGWFSPNHGAIQLPPAVPKSSRNRGRGATKRLRQRKTSR